jgi:hypothetical protein
MARVLNVAHILPYKVADDRRADVADQIGGKNEAPIQRNHYIYASSPVFPVYLASQRRHP